MTRVFRDEDVTHVDGEVNPESDITTVQTEMILADLQTVEKAIPRLEKEARGNKALAANLAAAQEAAEVSTRRNSAAMWVLEPVVSVSTRSSRALVHAPAEPSSDIHLQTR